MTNNKQIKTVMEQYNKIFSLNSEKINFIHKKYINEFNKAYKNSKIKDPDKFIDNILNFMISNDFDDNFIRAIFGKPSISQPLYKQEIADFKSIFVSKMLKK